MAHKAGEAGWSLDGQEIQSEKEKQDTEGKAKLFCEKNFDIINPMLARIEEFKSKMDADSLLLLAATLQTTVNSIMKTKVVVTATASENTKN